jgi:hypothetical protein
LLRIWESEKAHTFSKMDVVRKEGANRTPSGLDGRHPCCGNNRLHPSAAGNTYAIRFHPTFLDGPVTFHLVTTFHLDTFHPVLLFRTSHRADQEDICLFSTGDVSNHFQPPPTKTRLT